MLDQICGDDAALRAEVEALLAAQVGADETIKRAIRREEHLAVAGEPRAAPPNIAALSAPPESPDPAPPEIDPQS